jgi:hypothetical protein
LAADSFATLVAASVVKCETAAFAAFGAASDAIFAVFGAMARANKSRTARLGRKVKRDL